MCVCMHVDVLDSESILQDKLPEAVFKFSTQHVRRCEFGMCMEKCMHICMYACMPV